MLKYVNIYGERCSGTNYLEELIKQNFDVDITSKHGFKHFFGFRDFTTSDDTLFIGIIRSPYDWINSFYRDKWHLPEKNTSSVESFLNNEHYSIDKTGEELMQDRHIYTNERYKNIFELRHIKNKFLIEDMSLLVKNYLLISYESLLYDFTNIMNKIKNKGLIVKSNIEFPVNVKYYRKYKKTPFVINSKPNYISKEQVMEKFNMTYEKLLFEDYI